MNKVSEESRTRIFCGCFVTIKFRGVLFGACVISCGKSERLISLLETLIGASSLLTMSLPSSLVSFSVSKRCSCSSRENVLSLSPENCDAPTALEFNLAFNCRAVGFCPFSIGDSRESRGVRV